MSTRVGTSAFVLYWVLPGTWCWYVLCMIRTRSLGPGNRHMTYLVITYCSTYRTYQVRTSMYLVPGIPTDRAVQQYQLSFGDVHEYWGISNGRFVWHDFVSWFDRKLAAHVLLVDSRNLAAHVLLVESSTCMHAAGAYLILCDQCEPTNCALRCYL